ncbi:MAG: hypothetical protein ABMB14_13380 [Myxococcota bacterium]
MTDPEVLQTQWTEQGGLLVHTSTVTGSESSLATANGLAVGALASLGFAAGAVGQGMIPLAVLCGAAAIGCGLGLARIAALQRRAPAPKIRRLLVEIGPDRLSWTWIDGDRWSMRHDHEAPLGEVVDAAPSGTPVGPVVVVKLAGDRRWELPLHGLPSADAGWLSERIVEGARAKRDTTSAG